MSINGAMLNADGSPILISGEKLFYSTTGVRLELESGSGYPGSSNNLSLNFKTGSIVVTNLRIIYVPLAPMPSFKNLNIPLEHLRGGKLVQPWFDANRYEATVLPVPFGGLNEQAQVKFSFKDGGGFEFSSIYEQLRSRLANQPVSTEEPLPLYNAASSSARASAPPAAAASPPPVSSPAAPPPPHESEPAATETPQNFGRDHTTSELPPSYDGHR